MKEIVFIAVIAALFFLQQSMTSYRVAKTYPVRDGSVLRHATVMDFEQYAQSALLNSTVRKMEEFNVKEEPANRRTGLCSLLPPGISASHLWKEHAEKLANITGRGIYKDETKQPAWIEEMMEFLSPRFLRLGYRAPPLPETLQVILDIVYKRIQDPESNPPLKIAIFGGSVTLGRGSCVDRFSDSNRNQDPAPKKQHCTWVNRMQVYADEFLGPNVIQVINLAAGGTNTGLATPIVLYQLYEQGSSLLPNGPDIIINSYTTNDALNHNHDHDATNSTSFMETKLELQQQFIRSAMRSRPCSSLPLVAYFHDYVGNMHDRLLGEHINKNAIQELSGWYHTALISYSDAVERIVLANDKELAFSALWKHIDVHFGLQGHVAASWVLAFGVLQAVVDHCEDDYQVKETPFGEHHNADVMDLVERVAPPPLNRETRLSTVSNKWKTEKERVAQEDRELCGVGDDSGSGATSAPCVLAFVANTAGTVRKAKALNKYLRPYIAANVGWIAKDDISQGGWSNKLGWVASEPGASLTLFADNIHTQARFIRIFHLKSYGEAWKNSTVSGTVRNIDSSNNNAEVVGEFTLEGFWEDKFSLTVPYTIDLQEKAVQPGNRIELSLDLVEGAQFKITSIMVCNHE